MKETFSLKPYRVGLETDTSKMSRKGLRVNPFHVGTFKMALQKGEQSRKGSQVGKHH